MQQKSITVGELMDKYVQVYSMNHRGDSFLYGYWEPLGLFSARWCRSP